MKRCHSLGCSLHSLFSMIFRVPLNFSVIPLHIGVVVNCLILKRRVRNSFGVTRSIVHECKDLSVTCFTRRTYRANEVNSYPFERHVN